MSPPPPPVFPPLGAGGISAATPGTGATGSAPAPPPPQAKAPPPPAASQRPCTPFSGCAGAGLTSSAALSSPLVRSHSHCSHGREKPQAGSGARVLTGVTVSATRTAG